MQERKSEQPADPKRTERRRKVTVSRALLLSALSFGSLVGAAAAASANPHRSDINCEYGSDDGDARPIVAAEEASSAARCSVAE